APYLMFAMVFAGYLWLSLTRAGKLSKGMAWVCGVLIAVFLFFFILSQTRGAFLGLAAGLLVFLVYLVIAGRGPVRKWATGILVFLALIGGGLYAVKDTAFVQKFPESRLLQLSLSDYTAQTRLWVWSEARQGFFERPILGWGPENFTPVFDKHF